VSAPGTYLLRAHYVPFWQVKGAVCVRPGPQRTTRLEIAAPGDFSLAVAPTGKALLRAATGPPRCSPRA
jgi:hypothetical protein